MSSGVCTQASSAQGISARQPKPWSPPDPVVPLRHQKSSAFNTSYRLLLAPATVKPAADELVAGPTCSQGRQGSGLAFDRVAKPRCPQLCSHIATIRRSQAGAPLPRRIYLE